jgi:hypothetical protein
LPACIVYLGMPFTFSHPAIVLPFGKLAKNRLSVTGLVIGSMVPDLEYFLRMKMESIYSHTWEGLIWFDIPLGCLLVLGYELFIKDALITHLPAFFNKRFFGFKGYRQFYSPGYLVAILVSVLLGAASHIFWDSFTHPAGIFVHRHPVLKHIILIHGYRIYIYTLLQYASTVLGGLFILTVCIMLPKGELTKVKNISGFWLQVTLVTVVAVAIRLASGLSVHQYGSVIVTVISGGLLGVLTASLLAPKTA